jgi:hypothetical protein
MQKINFELALATLLPEFIMQFLLSSEISQNSSYCIELEDLRDSLKRVDDPEIADIKKFLSLESGDLPAGGHTHECDGECGHEVQKQTQDEDIPEELRELDPELEEVDNEYFHVYTPAELRYIFDRINNSIEKLYRYYMDYATVNLTLTIGFRFENGLESALVVEYIQDGLGAAPWGDDCLELPVNDARVSDDIKMRACFSIDPDKKAQYIEAFSRITEMLNVKHDDRYTKGYN